MYFIIILNSKNKNCIPVVLNVILKSRKKYLLYTQILIHLLLILFIKKVCHNNHNNKYNLNFLIYYKIFHDGFIKMFHRKQMVLLYGEINYFYYVKVLFTKP